MQYMLMIYNDEAEMQALPAEKLQPRLAAYSAFTETITKAGIVVGSNRLRPSGMATTVRIKDGKNHVLDGPYADSKEQLGGYYLIDVPDLDAALAWAARCPGATHGSIEVRPVWTM